MVTEKIFGILPGLVIGLRCLKACHHYYLIVTLKVISFSPLTFGDYTEREMTCNAYRRTGNYCYTLPMLVDNIRDKMEVRIYGYFKIKD